MKPKFRIESLIHVVAYLAFSFVLSLFWASYSAKAQNFHLLIFADTDDPGLSAPNLMNISYLTEMADDVCKSTGMINKMAVYKGKDFVASRYDQVISSFHPEPNDVVFFYFMGHGWNNSESEEPMLLFKAAGQSPGAANSRNLKVVFEQLRRKGSRLTLAFGESCNSAINDRSRAKPGSGRVMNASEIKAEQLKNLFLNSRAAILLHTCKRGQKSNSSEDGGWFFTTFYEQYKQLIAKSYKKQPAEWNALLTASAKATEEYAREQGAVQEPVFQLFAGKLTQQATSDTPLAKTTPSARKEVPGAQPSNSPIKTEDGKPSTNASEASLAINRTAFNTLRSHLVFLEGFLKEIQDMEDEAAADKFSKYYSTDRQEFFRQIPQKLNLLTLADPSVDFTQDDFTTTCTTIAQNIGDMAYYVDNPPEFKRTATGGRLSEIVGDLRLTIKRVQNLLRRTKE